MFSYSVHWQRRVFITDCWNVSSYLWGSWEELGQTTGFSPWNLVRNRIFINRLVLSFSCQLHLFISRTLCTVASIDCLWKRVRKPNILFFTGKNLHQPTCKQHRKDSQVVRTLNCCSFSVYRNAKNSQVRPSIYNKKTYQTHFDIKQKNSTEMARHMTVMFQNLEETDSDYETGY